MSTQWSDETVETVAQAIHHPQSGRWDHLEYWDKDYLRDRARVVLAVLAEDGLLVQPSGAPRTWSLPPEPGPEVTAVRDGRGEVWNHDGGTSGFGWYRPNGGRASWWWLIGCRSPLTDASSTPPLTAALTGAPEGAGDAPPASPA